MSGENRQKNEGEKRSYFRVDDVISVIVNPVNLASEKDREILKDVASSRTFSLLKEQDTSELERLEGASEFGGNRKLFEVINEIKLKLDFLINHFFIEKEGLSATEKKLVNISASGIKFTIKNPVKEKDILEIKLLLPTYPPVAVFAYGEVKRVKLMEDQTYEVALEYLNMGETVRNEIIQYTLNHQRETIKKIKVSGKHE